MRYLQALVVTLVVGGFSFPLSAVPSAPTLNQAQVTGATVSLSWSIPLGTTGFRLEAGTAPGASNAVNTVLPAIVSFTAANVPAGTYYVRVRAIDASGESATSNGVVVVVGASGCSSPPQAPTLAPAQVAFNIVSLSWTPSAAGCPATSFNLLAGSAPGLVNAAAINTPANVLSAFAPDGTYYVRVRALNQFGIGPVSNEIVVVVGSVVPPIPPVPSPGSFGPGQWRVGTQIAPGRYFSAPSNGCYWERQRGLSGSINDVIANEFIGFNALRGSSISCRAILHSKRILIAERGRLRRGPRQTGSLAAFGSLVLRFSLEHMP
jgi:hypothetical protein